jgi:hypothetical protein
VILLRMQKQRDWIALQSWRMTHGGRNPEVRVWTAKTFWGRWRSRYARHAIFCLGEGDEEEKLEQCHARFGIPWGCHDEFDRRGDTLFIGVSYGWHIIGTARIILGALDKLPTGMILDLMPDRPTTYDDRNYAEPSRFSIRAKYRTSHIAIPALYGLVGQVMIESIARGCEHFLLTARMDLYDAFPWFPWVLTVPFRYPVSEGGPIPDEPMWGATLALVDVIAAAQERDKGRPAAAMFPHGPVPRMQGQPIQTDQRKKLVKHNRDAVLAIKGAHTARTLQLKVLAVSSRK